MSLVLKGIVYTFALAISLSSYAAVNSAANNVSSGNSSANNVGNAQTPVDNSRVQPGSAQNPVVAAPTAQNQSTTTNDAELTRRIRADLMSRNLSTAAKNVTIVTIDGMVSLRGTVPTSEEKAMLGEVATRFAPNVRNDVVVKQ